MRQLLEHQKSEGNYYVATGEPFVDQYLARRDAAIATLDNDDNWRTNDSTNVARRADIALIFNSLDRQPNAVLCLLYTSDAADE